jgi:hypothetical protein
MRSLALLGSILVIAACGGTDVHGTDGGTHPDAPPIHPDASIPDAMGCLCDAPNIPDAFIAPADASMCGEAVLPITPGTMVTGSTAGLMNVTQGSCGGATAGEQVYQFTIAASTGVTITTDFPATDFNTAIYLRSDCTNAGTQLGCASNGMLGDTMTASLAPGTYYVYVDGIAGTSGNYGLEVNLTPILPVGSPCDPAGVMNMCATGLVCEDVGAGPVCTDPAAACLASAMTITADGTPVTGTTVGGTSSYTPGCSTDGGAPDNVWAVTVPPGSTGDLIITATQTSFATDMFDIILSVSTGCDDATMELGCSDGPNAADPETVTIPSAAPGTYYIMVDGYNGHAGAYSLTATLTTTLVEGATCDITSTTMRCDGATDWCFGTPSTCQPVSFITDTSPNATFCAAQGPTATDLVVDGQMNGATDPDTYSITLGAPFTAMHAYTDDGFGGCAADTTISIYDAMGMTCTALDAAPQTPIASDTDSGPGLCSDVTATGLTAGTYYIQVTYGGMGTGPYHLVVDLQ